MEQLRARKRESQKAEEENDSLLFLLPRGLWLAQAGTAGLKEEMAEDFFPVRSLTPVSQRHVSEKREVKSVGGFFQYVFSGLMLLFWEKKI